MVMMLAVMIAGCAKGNESAPDDLDNSETTGENGKYSVEEVGFERDGLHIYGELSTWGFLKFLI